MQPKTRPPPFTVSRQDRSLSSACQALAVLRFSIHAAAAEKTRTCSVTALPNGCKGRAGTPRRRLWCTFSILSRVVEAVKQMRAVVQRVSRARVTVQSETVAEIGIGFLVLLGIGSDDHAADAVYLAEKICGLRVFEDDGDKMNLTLGDAGGSVLAVSQFTLYGDVRRGKRPSFDNAAPPDAARPLYEFFIQQVRAIGLRCESGRFQEKMQVELANEGPVTILLDSKKLF